jgi:hypothetical protein
MLLQDAYWVDQRSEKLPGSVVSFVIQELSLLFFFLQALDLLMSHFESSGCDKNNRSQSETQENQQMILS